MTTVVIKKKRKRGRPKKNADLNLHILPISKNINVNNIYPPNKIITKKVANEIINNTNNLKALAICNKPKIFETLLSEIKGKHKSIFMIFAKDGIIFSHNKRLNIQDKSSVVFECKIFPDELLKYELYKSQTETDIVKQVLYININKLYKIFKSIPKDNIVELTINDSEYIHKQLFIVNYEPSKIDVNKTTHVLDINSKIGYYPISFDDHKYDVIVMMESKYFHDMCKNINSFNNVFNIEFIKCANNSYELLFTHTKDNHLSTISHKEYNKFKFLSYSDKIIKNTFKIDSFIKYTKSHSFSTIVKLYLSQDKRLIIEYNIDPGMGTYQIFIDPIKKIQN